MSAKETQEEKCARCREDGLREDEECEYYGEPNGCNSPTYGKYQVRHFHNMAVMREAAKKVVEAIRETRGVLCDIDGWKAESCNGCKFESLCRAGKECEDAIGASPRNCDIYDDPYEAADHWPDEEMCAGRRMSNGTCDGCRYSPARCVARWMYEVAKRGSGEEGTAYGRTAKGKEGGGVIMEINERLRGALRGVEGIAVNAMHHQPEDEAENRRHLSAALDAIRETAERAVEEERRAGRSLVYQKGRRLEG